VACAKYGDTERKSPRFLPLRYAPAPNSRIQRPFFSGFEAASKEFFSSAIRRHLPVIIVIPP
jgi:hypothetical protein